MSLIAADKSIKQIELFILNKQRELFSDRET